jgi:hypothetical protein
MEPESELAYPSPSTSASGYGSAYGYESGAAANNVVGCGVCVGFEASMGSMGLISVLEVDVVGVMCGGGQQQASSMVMMM